MTTTLPVTSHAPRHAVVDPTASPDADRPILPDDSTLPDDSATPALAMQHVTVRHPDGANADGTPRFHTAVDEASLALQPGTFTLLLGPSGSGKSTLLSSAAGLVLPDSGRIQLAGREITTLDDDARSEVRRTLLGMVFQQPNLFASLTVMEQLLLPATLSGRRPTADTRERARDLLHRVGLDGLEQRRPHQLSGGQRQRVAIARALMGTPRLLLVDEPTSALDRDAAHRVTDLFAGITHDLGVATLMVTHDQTLAEHADQVLTISDGHLRAADADAVTSHPSHR